MTERFLSHVEHQATDSLGRDATGVVCALGAEIFSVGQNLTDACKV
jgi:hypothetical protein